MENKIYANMDQSITPEKFIAAMLEINKDMLNDSLLMSGEPDKNSYNITVKSKFSGYPWLILKYSLTNGGKMIEWSYKGDMFVIWLTEFVGNILCEKLGAMLTYESNLELSEKPNFHKAYPKLSDFLKFQKKASINEYSYLIPENLINSIK
jgi:hypothetical protein